MTSLTGALVTLGDPLLPVRVQSRELLVLMLSAGVRIAPERMGRGGTGPARGVAGCIRIRPP